jgi:hypothetical protein
MLRVLPRHGADPAWAYLVGGDAGALHPCGLFGVACGGGSDRGIGDWTQMDPNRARGQKAQGSSKLKTLDLDGRGERIRTSDPLVPKRKQMF